MTSWRLYNLFRRAGNSPCQAFRLAQRTQPGAVESTLCYVGAVLLAAGTAALAVLG